MAQLLGTSELTSVATLRAVIAETVGVLVLVLIGTGVIVASGAVDAGALSSARLAIIALAIGLTYMALVALTLGISGGHINPAVTFAAVITGRMTLPVGGLYIVGQVAGAIAASFILKALLADAVEGNLGAVAVNDAAMANLGAAFAIELILGFVLVFVVLAVAVGPGASAAPAIAPVGIGLIVVVGTFLGLALTGAAMNPARALGPAWAAGVWTDHWIYWLGPLAGAAIAALLYDGVYTGRLLKLLGR